MSSAELGRGKPVEHGSERTRRETLAFVGSCGQDRRMRKQWCSVCPRADVAEINRLLLDPRQSLRSIGQKHGIQPKTLKRHRDRHLADKAAKALEIHAKVTEALEVASTGSAIDVLISEARRDRERALDRGDHRLALRAIDTLLKAHELHARLVIESARGTARDVADHPVFKAWIAKQARVLCTACSAATAALASHELGVDVPITVHAQGTATP